MPRPTADSAVSSTPGPRVRPVPAVTRTIAILRLLGDSRQPLGVKAVADALGIIPSTCLHILRVLVAESLVTVDPATKKYALGSGMISLARSVLQGGGFAPLAQPALDRLAAEAQVTAMGVEITPRQGCVVLAISRTSQYFRLHTDVGSQFNTLVSATGRLIAAHQGESVAQLRKRFAQIVWDQAPTFDAWRQQVAQARAQGWSLDRNHFMNGVTVVAVPLVSSTARLTHTLVAVGLSSHMDDALVVRIVAQMKDEAARIGAALVES